MEIYEYTKRHFQKSEWQCDGCLSYLGRKLFARETQTKRTPESNYFIANMELIWWRNPQKEKKIS